MGNVWRDTTLGELADINPRRSLKRGCEYPFISMSALEPYYRFAKPDEVREMKSGGSKFQAGDVLLARITPCLENGKTAVATGLGEGAGFGSTEFVVLAGKSGVSDSDFIFEIVRSEHFRRYAVQGMTGSTGRQRVPVEVIASYALAIPPLDEQRAIAAILSAFDDKIELNRRTAATLEEMARAVFKSWFVDFDPVRAKAEGRQPEWMDAETAALFPDSFGDDGLPEGWTLASLSDIADSNRKTLSPKLAPLVIKYIDIGSVGDGSVESITSLEFASAPSRARRVVEHGDTIWSTVRPNRRAHALILNPAPNTIASTGFVTLAERDGNWALLYALTDVPAFADYLTSVATGSAYPAVRPPQVMDAPVVLSPSAVRASFQSAVAPGYSRCGQMAAENQTLASIRDTLLPRLLSGEIRVSDAEKIAEGAL